MLITCQKGMEGTELKTEESWPNLFQIMFSIELLQGNTSGWGRKSEFQAIALLHCRFADGVFVSVYQKDRSAESSSQCGSRYNLFAYHF